MHNCARGWAAARLADQLAQSHPQLRKTLLRNVSELVAAVTLARNVQLSAIGAKLPVTASAEARQQWVRRQLCNDTEDTLRLFRPLAASLLSGLAGRSVRLILDPTDLAADLTIVWIPVIRTKGNLLVELEDGTRCRVADLAPAPGQRRFYQRVWLTGWGWGPYSLSLANAAQAKRGQKAEDPWYIVCTEPATAHILTLYAARMWAEIVFTQMTKGCLLASRCSWDDVADFHLGVVNDDAVNQQLYQLSALGESELLEGGLQAPTEVFDAGGELDCIQLLLGLRLQLTQLLRQAVLRLGEFLALALELLSADHLGQVQLEQAGLLALDVG